MKTTKSRISARGRERKARQKIGRKILASVLCAFLSVGNSTNLMVAATEPDAETIDGGDNTVEAQSDEMCVHGMPNGEHCVPCVQEGVREIIEVLTEQKIPANPLQTVYEDIEKVYDIYVTLDNEELSQLTEDEYDWLETLLVKEQELIGLLDELDRQVAEQGTTDHNTLSALYQIVAESYGVFMQNKEAQQEEQVQNPEEDVPANQDIVQDESALKQDTSVLAEGKTEQNTETTPDETGNEEQADMVPAEKNKMEITSVSIKDSEGKIQTLKDKNQSETNTVFSMKYDQQVTLHIEVESELNLKNKKVEITIPDGMVVVEYPKPNSPTDFVQSVSPESLDDLNSQQSYGSYRPKNGKITYSLGDTAVNTSFNIILAFDTTLWNKQWMTDYNPAPIITDAIQIRTYSQDGENQENLYDSFSADGTLTNEYLRKGPYLNTAEPKNKSVKPGKEAFKLTDIRYRPDQYEFSMGSYYKTFTMTINMPIKTHKDGDITKNTYAKLDHIESDSKAWNLTELDASNVEYSQDGSQATITWKDLYISGDDFITPPILFGMMEMKPRRTIP